MALSRYEGMEIKQEYYDVPRGEWRVYVLLLPAICGAED